MTNSSKECSFTAIDHVARTVELGISIPTFILGLVLNTLALAMFCRSWREQTKTSVYMTSLALADALLLLSLPLKLYYSAIQAPGLLCTFIEVFYFVSTYCSIFIIVCITVDRYICIRNPFEGRANQSPRGAVLVCCFIWAVAWICSSPILLFHKKDDLECFHNMTDTTWSVPLIVCVEIFGFLIPLAVMVFCSAHTIRILLNHRNQTKKKVGDRGSLRVIIMNLVVFLVCFTPLHLAICLQFLVKQQVIEDCGLKQTISLFLQVSMTFANLNCCLDAIFYYFAAKEFSKKTHLKKIIKQCPVFKPCGMQWDCQHQRNAPCQDTDSVTP